MAKGKRRKQKKPEDPFVPSHQVVPLLAGSIGTEGDTIDARIPHAMFVVLNPDDAPGLRNVLKRQKSGHEFDVVTRAGVGMIEGSTASPFALIGIAFPEAALAIEVALEVDEYRRSLLTAIRTNRIMLMDPETSLGLQSMTPREAFSRGLSMTVPLENTTPIMGLLQQRVDLPLPEYKPVTIDVSNLRGPTALDEFLTGTVVPDAIAVQYRVGGTPSIIVVDSRLPRAPEAYSEDTPLEGRWAAMLGNEHSVARLDTFHGGEPFRSWVIPQPDAQIARAGASGAHHVKLLRERPSSDASEAQKQWEAGLSAWIENVESLRSLLIHMTRSSGG